MVKCLFLSYINSLPLISFTKTILDEQNVSIHPDLYMIGSLLMCVSFHFLHSVVYLKKYVCFCSIACAIDIPHNL